MLSNVKYLSQILRILLILENIYKRSMKLYVTLVREEKRSIYALTELANTC